MDAKNAPTPLASKANIVFIISLEAKAGDYSIAKIGQQTYKNNVPIIAYVFESSLGIESI